MAEQNKFLLVDLSVLPEVFTKVVEAKRYMAQGKAKSYSDAAKMAGISRSAFYKYKDFVFKYSGSGGNTLSLNAALSDRAGVFSALTAALYDCGANIITVSQGLPENGKANVSLTVSISSEIGADGLINRLLETDGVISIKRIDGGKK